MPQFVVHTVPGSPFARAVLATLVEKDASFRVAALVPGILTYEAKNSGTVYVGIDQGVLVKAGAQVTVSVRRAFGGSDLGQIKSAVERDFQKLDERERSVRTAVGKMESGLMERLAEFKHDR